MEIDRRRGGKGSSHRPTTLRGVETPAGSAVADFDAAKTVSGARSTAFMLWNANKFSSSLLTVPEPQALRMLVFLAWLGVAKRRRREESRA